MDVLLSKQWLNNGYIVMSLFILNAAVLPANFSRVWLQKVLGFKGLIHWDIPTKPVKPASHSRLAEVVTGSIRTASWLHLRSAIHCHRQKQTPDYQQVIITRQSTSNVAIMALAYEPDTRCNIDRNIARNLWIAQCVHLCNCYAQCGRSTSEFYFCNISHNNCTVSASCNIARHGVT